MAWTYLKQYLFAGTVTDPRDFMENVNGLASEVNGFVDRDNVVENAVNQTKVVTGAFNTTGMTTLDLAVSGTGEPLSVGETGAWHEISELTTSVSTEDGRLTVDAWVNYVTTTSPVVVAAAQDVLEFRLLIDGQVVDETGWISAFKHDGTVALVASLPVDSGTHTVIVQYRAYGKLLRSLTKLAKGRPVTITDFTAATLNAYKITRGVVVYRHQKR